MQRQQKQHLVKKDPNRAPLDLNSPIGVFDSGLGGLTVLHAIAEQLPRENLIYVGDTARVPYGVKSPETVTRYAIEICDFLLSKKVKAIVVACNTAASFALPYLQKTYSVPIVGVLEPGAKAAAAVTKNQHIGVIGTEGTIRSNSYAQALKKILPDLRLSVKACPLFVPLVEEGWIEHEVTRKVAEIYLETLQNETIDTLILGCTHYPLLKDLLQRILGGGVHLVDSAYETAKFLVGLLEEGGLRNLRQGVGFREFFVTDAPEKFCKLGKQFLGGNISKVHLTDLALCC